MTTDITELAQRMKAAAEKATPGEWWADEVKNEGCYGSGDDCVEGFISYAIYGSDGQTLFDSLNSDSACISEEYDGEGHVAWDETAQRNAEFIALANPANILALVEALEKAKGMEAYWKVQCRGITDHCEVLQARIAELESRIVKLPDDAEHDIMAPVAAYLSEKFKWDGGAARWDGRKEYDVLADRVKYALRMVIRRAAGIKVEAE